MATRLGGSAFNHSQSADAEQEYDRLRNLARQEHEKMSSCFDRAHQAYESHDGERAHELSEEGHKHQAKRDEYNKQASEFIFRENNATDRVESDTIDLHGLYVEEAEHIVETRIKAAQQQHQTHLHVIVGKGNHSVDHVQKIKPAVEKLCREQGLSYRTEENEGRIYVDLTGGKGGHGGPSPGKPAQHFQEERPQHQQSHQPHQQQQQGGGGQNDDDKGLITSCLNRLCVIM